MGTYPNPLRFVDECVGFSHDQKDMELGARDAVTTRPVGYISYSIFQDEIHIKMIETSPKRQGIATQLFKHLQSLYPNMKINHGMSTGEGSAWLKSLKPDPMGRTDAYDRYLGEGMKSQPDPHEQYLAIWVRGNCKFAAKKLRAWLNGNCRFAQVSFPPETVRLVKVNPYQALRNMAEEQPELVPVFLNAYGQVYAPRKVSFKSAAPVIVVKIGGSSYVVENDSVKEASEFIVDKSERELLNYVPARDFNKDFWQFPETLFHATDPKNAQSILTNGLKPDNRTRGIANRGMGNAVFASTDPETISSYGSAIIAIDTRAMKADGYVPRVAMESPLEEENMRSALAHKLGVEYVSEPEAGLDERTVVVFGAIPAKYLTRVA